MVTLEQAREWAARAQHDPEALKVARRISRALSAPVVPST